MTSAKTQFAFRTQKAIGVIDAAPVYESLSGFEKPEGIHRACRYSPNGQFFAYAGVEDVKIVNPDDGQIVGTIAVPNVLDLGFSPLGSFLITLERNAKAEDGNAYKNMKVWRTSTKEMVASFVQKGLDSWNLQYTYDEKYCARAVTNEIQFYESDKMNTVWGHLRVEGVTSFELSPGKNYSVAVFVGERKGQPAIVRTYAVPDFKNHLQQKSFFKADKVQMKWNALGTAVLVLTQTEVDKTGKSYYGETNLYLMHTANNFDCRVALDKDGAIHDIAWSPNSREFGVVYGYMPAKTTLFNMRANPVHSLPLAPRNTIQYSPHGRFLLVAGFGNLQGQMDIFDREKNMAKIATIEASNTTVCEWSPDGRHILTATTSPRLRVDNGLKMWFYTGELMYHCELEELYNVFWRPAPVDAHPLSQPLPVAPAPHSSAAKHVATSTPVKPAGAYRPPHARGSATPLLFKREDEGGAAHVVNGTTNPNGGVNGFGPGKPRGRREVPGAAPAEPTPAAGDDSQLSKSALKNKKKREAAKKKAEQEKASGGAQQGGEKKEGEQKEQGGQPREGRNPRTETLANRRNDHRSRSRANQDHRRSKSRPNNGAERNNGNGNGHHREGSKHLSPANITTDQPAADGPLSPSPEEKKRRALHKKLRAIEDLKMRQASGEKLEDTQIKKIATEAEVRRDLEKLGGLSGSG